MSRTSVLIHFESYEAVRGLSAQDKGELLDCIFAYAMAGEIMPASPAVSMAFNFIRARLDKDNAKYAERCERSRENGKKGGRPSKSDNNPKNPLGFYETQNNPQEPNKSEQNPTEPKKPDTDMDTDMDNNDIIIPPSIPPLPGDSSETPPVDLPPEPTPPQKPEDPSPPSDPPDKRHVIPKSIPKDWTYSNETHAELIQEGISNETIRAALKPFIDYINGNSNKQKWTNFDSAFRNWSREDHRRRSGQGKPVPKGSASGGLVGAVARIVQSDT